MNRPRKKSRRKLDSIPGSSALEADALTTRPTRLLGGEEGCPHWAKTLIEWGNVQTGSQVNWWPSPVTEREGVVRTCPQRSIVMGLGWGAGAGEHLSTTVSTDGRGGDGDDLPRLSQGMGRGEGEPVASDGKEGGGPQRSPAMEGGGGGGDLLSTVSSDGFGGGGGSCP